MANTTFTVALQSGQRFATSPNTPIWEAAQAAGIVLPHSCRTGRCSSCKTKVLSGQTTALHAELGLTADEQAQGWVLSCVRAAQSDVLLDAGDILDVAWPKVQTLPCKIHSLERLATDVLAVQLRLPPTAAFTWLAGQYVEMIGPGGVRRAYSLANAVGAHVGAHVGAQEGAKQTNPVLLELHIRHVPGGAMSAYWFEQAKVGDLLRLNGPLGTFVWRPAMGQSAGGLEIAEGVGRGAAVLLATGTGIAPVLALLQALPQVAPAQRPSQVHVLWGGRVPDDFYVDVQKVVNKLGLALGIDTESKALSAQCVLSRPLAGWGGPKGYVQDHAALLPLDWAQAQVYACGSVAMINSARMRLVGLGLPDKQFYSDAFVCSAVG